MSSTDQRLINVEAAILKMNGDVATMSAYLKVLGAACAILSTALAGSLVYIILR